MFKLNLLPPKEKEELELANLSRLLLFLAVWFSVFLIIFTLFLSSTFLSLSILLKAQQELIEIRIEDKKIQRLVEIEDKIRQANQQFSQIYLKQNEFILWTPILEELSGITSRGIYLTSLSYQTNLNRINLSGWSNNRQNLLSFQKSLEENPYFTEIEAPLTNLIKQTDINFSFSFSPL